MAYVQEEVKILTDRAVSSANISYRDYVGSDAKLPSEDGEQLFKLA